MNETETPHTLHYIKAEVGYGGLGVRQIALVGEGKYTVVSVHEDWNAVGVLADAMIAWGETPKDERSWMDHVYSGVKANGQQIKRVIERNAPRKAA